MAALMSPLFVSNLASNGMGHVLFLSQSQSLPHTRTRDNNDDDDDNNNNNNNNNTNNNNNHNDDDDDNDDNCLLENMQSVSAVYYTI